jgi:hypothetical protein
MRRGLAFLTLGLSLSILIFNTGCGKDGGSVDLGATVTGNITIDGAAPPSGTSISFEALDGKAKSGGATVTGSTYTANVQPGKYRVVIRAPKTKSGKGENALAGDFFEETLPAKYNDKSELTLEVTAGKNNKDWDLKTK